MADEEKRPDTSVVVEEPKKDSVSAALTVIIECFCNAAS